MPVAKGGRLSADIRLRFVPRKGNKGEEAAGSRCEIDEHATPTAATPRAGLDGKRKTRGSSLVRS